MPMSRIWTGTPFTSLMTISPICSGVCTWPLTSPRNSWWLRVRSPGESITFVLFTASRMSCSVTCERSICAGSGVIWNSGTWPPCTRTLATPFSRFRRGFRS